VLSAERAALLYNSAVLFGLCAQMSRQKFVPVDAVAQLGVQSLVAPRMLGDQMIEGFIG